MSRSPDFSSRAGTAPRSSRRDTLALAVAAALALAAGAEAWQAQRESRESTASLDALRADLEATRERLRTLQGTKRAGSDALASRIVLSAEAPPARVLAELTALLPPDVRLDGLSLVYGAKLQVEARVVARRPAGYDQLVERLAGSRLFGDVVPGPESREPDLHSTLHMVYRPVP